MDNQETPKNYYEIFTALTERKVVGFETFNKTSDKALAGLVKKAARKICGNKKITQEELTTFLKKEFKKIEDKYDVDGSEPSHHVSFYVNKALESEGYNFEIDSYDIG